MNRKVFLLLFFGLVLPLSLCHSKMEVRDVSSEEERNETVLNSEHLQTLTIANDSELEIISSIQEKYPFYCEYPTEKGLSILVYQMAENSHMYSLVPDKEDPVDFYPWNIGATLTASQIKALLSFYNLKDEDIILHYCPCPISSYFGSRSVDGSVQALFDYKYAVGKNVTKTPDIIIP